MLSQYEIYRRSAEMELLSEIDTKIRNGDVLSISNVEGAFCDILLNEYWLIIQQLTVLLVKLTSVNKN